MDHWVLASEEVWPWSIVVSQLFDQRDTFCAGWCGNCAIYTYLAPWCSEWRNTFLWWSVTSAILAEIAITNSVRLKQCCRCIPTSVAIQLVSAFVLSRIDYCNSVLFGRPNIQLNRLQPVLNISACPIWLLLERPCNASPQRQVSLALNSWMHHLQAMPVHLSSLERSFLSRLHCFTCLENHLVWPSLFFLQPRLTSMELDRLNYWTLLMHVMKTILLYHSGRIWTQLFFNNS